MKKITLLSFVLLSFVFSAKTVAQTLNQNANWPNAAWTVTGTFNSAGLEADPTISANFAFNDDAAGSSSDDEIAAESPTIDLTAAVGAGETWMAINVDYVYNRFNNNEILALQYYDADGAAWIQWQIVATADTPGAPNSGFCAATAVTFSSEVLNVGGFTATQLSGFKYRMYFNDSVNGAGWVYGFCFQSPTITSSTPPTDLLDYYNLQYPATGSIGAGDTFDVYAQAYEAGLTDVTTGQSPGIDAWIGYSTADTDPSGPGWTWVPASFNAEVGNNDEYSLNLGTAIPSVGTFYYASRWRLNGGLFTYGGIQADESYGGIWGEDNNISGILTISGPSNDECSGAIALTVNADFSCAIVTPGTTLGATASPQPDDATGTPNNDVWFTFVATGASHQISIRNVVNLGGGTSTSLDMAMSVFDDLAGCNMIAANEVGESDPDSFILGGLTAGSTYYVRVYGWSTSIQNNSFDMCIGTPPAAPANDECDNAIQLTVNADLDCAIVTPGTTVAATQSPQIDDVSGTPNNDVWFSFIATQTAHQVSLNNVVAVVGNSVDMGMGVYDGTDGCNALVLKGSSDPNTFSVTGLTVGTVYYVRVYGWSSGTGTAQTNFDICLGTLPPPPVNDACSGANEITSLPYDFSQTDAAGSTNNDGFITACTTGATGMNDGLWFTFTPTSDGIVDILVTNVATGFDAQLDLYSGSCGAFTCVANVDSGLSGGNETISGQAVVAGIQYFINVGHYSQVTDNSEGNFDINVSGTFTLNVADFENANAFSYFPNPVKNELTLRAQSMIQNVSIYNMLGQEVLRTSPNTLESNVSMNQLQTGAYFMKVTINDSVETIRIIKE